MFPCIKKHLLERTVFVTYYLTNNHTFHSLITTVKKSAMRNIFFFQSCVNLEISFVLAFRYYYSNSKRKKK